MHPYSTFFCSPDGRAIGKVKGHGYSKYDCIFWGLTYCTAKKCLRNTRDSDIVYICVCVVLEFMLLNGISEVYIY